MGRHGRVISRETFADIARVPLFIKYPGQRGGSVDSRIVRTIDIFPTIADVLGIRLPWAVDGRLLLGPASHMASASVIRQDGSPLRASRREIDLGMVRTVAVRRRCSGKEATLCSESPRARRSSVYARVGCGLSTRSAQRFTSTLRRYSRTSVCRPG